jgi:hypothetical protein
LTELLEAGDREHLIDRTTGRDPQKGGHTRLPETDPTINPAGGLIIDTGGAVVSADHLTPEAVLAGPGGVDLPVDFGDLPNPYLAFPVLHVE